MRVKIVEDTEKDKILIGAQVDIETHNELEKLAEEQARTLASILRQALKMYVTLFKENLDPRGFPSKYK